MYLIKNDFDREVYLLNVIRENLELFDILDIYKSNHIERDIHDILKEGI